MTTLSARQFKLIVRSVCSEMNVDEDAVLGNSRKAHFTHPRQIICWVAHDIFDGSLGIIGAALRRDHTTILSSVRLIREKRRASVGYEKLLNEIIDAIEIEMLILNHLPWLSQILLPETITERLARS
jgi:chromosomal replication initiation ATPase DnaA